MEDNNTESEVSHQEYEREQEPEPATKSRKKPEYKRKNMEKARLTRLKQIKDKKKSKALEYDIKDEDSESDASEDEEVSEDMLKAMLKAKQSSRGTSTPLGKNKPKIPEANPDAEKVIGRIDRLEDIMTQLIEIHKKDRKKDKKKAQPKQPNNTKIVLLNPSNTEAPVQTIKQSQTDQLLDMIKNSGLLK